jgi:pimeloyl-ACP methyl ester carboxylesterase
VNATYVFVHGSNSNSFGWAGVQRELALLGRRTLAVDLPGHGLAARFPRSYQAPQDLTALAHEPSAMTGITLADNVAHVVGIVRRLAGPVVLVGHSRGGFTIGGVGAAVPELIARLVYVSAWCCTEPLRSYTESPENSTSEANALGATLLAGDPAEIGAVRLNWRAADLRSAQSALLADGTEDELLAFLNTLEPDEASRLGPGTEVDAGTWGQIPRTYIRLTNDRSIPLALQDKFIRDADALTPDNRFDVHSIESSHLGFMFRPQEIATILAGLG